MAEHIPHTLTKADLTQACESWMKGSGFADDSLRKSEGVYQSSATYFKWLAFCAGYELQRSK